MIRYARDGEEPKFDEPVLWMAWDFLRPALDEDAARYMAGEEIPGETKGWTMIRYRGLILGWGKGSGGVIKNHYPKGLRNQKLIP